jgi:hypothetical protein
MAYYGLRIGVAPAQLVDFVLGFVGLDPMADDEDYLPQELIPLLPPPQL